MPKVLILLLSLCLFWIIQPVHAQLKGEIEFTTLEYDFGKQKEDGGPLKYEFKFKNTGLGDVVLKDIKASCGCTTPSWSKEPVAPGKEGSIVASFDPLNRPGYFNKSLTVTADVGGEEKIIILKISGEIIPKPKE
ncbi:MAG: DUF1573 domain-containing protein [Bacteroidia bacterium]|nr:DUF1573 domain-containing protein [Bacteroidia bacterium]